MIYNIAVKWLKITINTNNPHLCGLLVFRMGKCGLLVFRMGKCGLLVFRMGKCGLFVFRVGKCGLLVFIVIFSHFTAILYIMTKN
jgi:hypothetical protein